MNGCKYLTPNGKSLTHLYAKSMHKLRLTLALFTTFKKLSRKTIVSMMLTDASVSFGDTKSTIYRGMLAICPFQVRGQGQRRVKSEF